MPKRLLCRQMSDLDIIPAAVCSSIGVAAPNTARRSRNGETRSHIDQKELKFEMYSSAGDESSFCDLVCEVAESKGKNKDSDAEFERTGRWPQLGVSLLVQSAVEVLVRAHWEVDSVAQVKNLIRMRTYQSRPRS